MSCLYSLRTTGDIMKNSRIISIFLAFMIMLLIVPITTSADSSYIRGDADGDGEVTIIDATVIQRWLIDIPVSYLDEKAADVDDNGVDIIDVTRIQRYLADIDNTYRIGEFVSEDTHSTQDKYELPLV